MGTFRWAIGISRLQDKGHRPCDEEFDKGEVGRGSTIGIALDILVMSNKGTFVGTCIMQE